MRFRSKVDAWLAITLVLSAVVSVATVGMTVPRLTGTAWFAMVALAVLGAGLPLWLLVSTFYEVDGEDLRVRSGPFAWRIPLASITQVTPSRSLLSSPALSLDRLRIEHGPGKVILLSPRDQQAFLRAIGK